MTSFVICLVLSVIIGITNAGLFECNSDADCAPSTATCVNNICQCPAKEILNVDGTKCLKLTTSITGACESDIQCSLIRGPVSCRDGKCLCPNNYVYLKRQCQPVLHNDLESCTTDDDCFHGIDYNSRVCQNGKCHCSEGYYDRAGVDCRRKAGLGDACVLNSDCQDEGALCTAHVCVDPTGNKNKSINNTKNKTQKQSITKTITIQNDNNPEDGKQLNEACVIGDTCLTPNAICNAITQTCFCRNGYFEDKGKCVKELGMECTDASECPSGSICEQNICTCAVKKHYNGMNTKCRNPAMLVDDKLTKCATEDSCRMLHTNYECDANKICSCTGGLAISEDFICELLCATDEDCQDRDPNKVCDAVAHECLCKPEYKMVDGVCHPAIDGACNAHEDCHVVVKDSFCNGKKICTCNDGFVQVGYDCFKNVKVNQECTYQEQCAWKWNTTCAETGSGTKKSCKCDPGYINVNGNCLTLAKRIGDYCTHPAVCLADTFCEKSKCTCTKGLTPSKDQVRCIQKTSDSSSAPKKTSTPLIPTTILTLTAILFINI